ncbi:MAG: chloride channel protein, partial [Planctomycetota bacterium]
MKTSGTRHVANIMEPFFAGRFVSWDELLLYLLAGVIGSITAIAAVGFNYLIDQVDMLAYGGRVFEGGFRAYHLFLILIPAAGGLLVGLIGRFYAREATGHGVPEVMYAIVRRDCKIKLHVAVARAVTAALTIGSGGSAGPEGPIIQIGAAIASWTGRFVHVLQHHMPVLIGCGAAAGIAAIFRAPIAGVLFVMEVFLRD